MVKIIVDGMGGDHAPAEIVKGAVQSLKARSDFKIVLTGEENALQSELKKYRYDAARIEVVACSQVITNDDIPTQAVRAKKDSSIVVGLNLLKTDEEAGAFVSAGSTGAVLTGGIMCLGRLKGVVRPALCPAIPNARGSVTLLCDCGANAECKPAYLAQFGVMATAYAKVAHGIAAPRVGLLSNGTEEHKGDPLHQEAYQLLKQTEGVSFAGNVEGRDIMFGDVDVVVSDGFSGNIALKALEGCGKTVATMLKKEFTASAGRKLSYLFARKAIRALSNTLDYSRFGGSVFLGLKKIVIKAHGSSKALSIQKAILQGVEAHEGGLIATLEQMLTPAAGEQA